MALSEAYIAQVRLLLRLLPIVAQEDCFALKGGTAINLFERDLPRLSVDIDLMYLPLHDRPTALAGIDAAMKRISGAITENVRGARIVPHSQEGAILRLLVYSDGTQVKIEVSPVLRGVVGPTRLMPVSAAVEEAFGFAETTLVSFEDLYAGKLMAALDRQHPRDLFDVRDLLAKEGLTDPLREAFIVYLLSHHRPMGEVLTARRKDIEREFRNGFEGMTQEPIKLADLEATRETMIEQLVGGMPDRHRSFLIGFEEGTPDWAELHIEGVSALPAVQWRQRNLDLLDAGRRAALVESLRASLGQRTTGQ
jgi:predicted nucleotidyltransferase component of viral defense system